MPYILDTLIKCSGLSRSKLKSEKLLFENYTAVLAC